MQNLGELLIEAGLDIENVPRKKKRNGRKYRSSRDRQRVRFVLEIDPICRYCLIAESTTVDHVIPVSRGGTNILTNMVGCCEPCNQLKANMTPEEAGMVLYLPDRILALLNEGK